MNRKLRARCLHVLHRTFRAEGFRPGQEQAVSALLSGRDLLCVLPTGAGKSLCYQLPAVVKDGLTLVISPLIALMQDQTARLSSLGVPCAALTSQLDRHAQEMIFRRVQTGGLKLLYVAPERLQNPAFAALMREHPPVMIAVDEAHCVVRWGEAFRPAYAAIGSFVTSLPTRPVVCAMTATADQRMLRAIAQSLGLHHPKQVILPVLRENLRYAVHMTPSRDAALCKLVNAHDEGRTIIYCDTRVRTEQVARLLNTSGVPAAHYHAGMNAAERTRVQQAFSDGSCRVIAATVAFGMGVDVRGVRRIIHDDLPKDVIEYVQQTGRAGRDGEPADCIFLLSPSTLTHRRRKLTAARRDARKSLPQLLRFIGEWRDTAALMHILCGGGCIRQGLVSHFGHRARPCGVCSACRDDVVPQLPSLACASEKAIVYRCLQIARDRLAESLDLAPLTIASGETLRRIASSGCILPADRLHHAARPVFQMILDDVHAV